MTMATQAAAGLNESNSASCSPEQVLLQSFGTKKPADDPRAVRPANFSGAAAMLSGKPRRSRAQALTESLQSVVVQTSGVITGGDPDTLIQPFVSADDVGTARLLASALASRLVGEERRPDTVIGYGVYGGILTFLLAEALLELGCESRLLGIEQNNRKGSEGYHFLGTETEIKARLSGKKVVLVFPILTGSHISTIFEIKALIEGEKCATTIAGVATIIQYGDVPLSQVESLLKITL